MTQSYTLASIGLGALVIVLHAWWLSRSDHAGEVLSACGAAIVVVGLFVAAVPFLRAGVEAAAREKVQAPQGAYYDSAVGAFAQAAQAAYLAKVEAAIPGIWTERVVAVAIVIVGTLLNGYGTPIARVLGMKI